MTAFKVISSTMCVSTPATVAEDAVAGSYRWHGHEDWEPGHPKYRDDRATPAESQQQNVARSGAKRRRVAEYTRLRLAKVSKEDAAAAIGITSSTMGYYERDFAAKHPQEAKP